MSLPLILAVLIALGFEPSDKSVSPTGADVWSRLIEMGLVIGTVAVISRVLGHWILIKSRSSANASSARRAMLIGSRFLDLLLLAAYVLIVFVMKWPDVVRSGLGLQHAILVDELLILGPYIIGQMMIWGGLYPAARQLNQASHRPQAHRNVLTYVMMKTRQSLGLLLPIALAFPLGQDLARRYWPGWSESPFGQFFLIALTGIAILIVSPALIRIAWSTRPLPVGPTRDRLERLAIRHQFRYTDILIWQTENTIANAGVTGIFAWFRYILLTDGLLESLDTNEVSAVFGHEMGHIAYRHLFYFGFFFLMSMGLVAIGSASIETFSPVKWSFDFSQWSFESGTRHFAAGLAVVLIGSMMICIFGHLSRCFEREADIYGCRAVSCGRQECPPHLNLEARDIQAKSCVHVCPVGISIFVRALTRVASRNRVGIDAKSWRHGTIAHRIAFLEGLEGHPRSEDVFARKMLSLRVGLAVGLVGLLIVAMLMTVVDPQTVP